MFELFKRMPQSSCKGYKSFMSMKLPKRTLNVNCVVPLPLSLQIWVVCCLLECWHGPAGVCVSHPWLVLMAVELMWLVRSRGWVLVLQLVSAAQLFFGFGKLFTRMFMRDAMSSKTLAYSSRNGRGYSTSSASNYVVSALNPHGEWSWNPSCLCKSKKAGWFVRKFASVSAWIGMQK